MKTPPAKQPVNDKSELETKMEQADPMIKQAFSECKKEIARLQQQLVKEQIAHESEIERMKAQFEKQMQPRKVQDMSPKERKRLMKALAAYYSDLHDGDS